LAGSWVDYVGMKSYPTLEPVERRDVEEEETSEKESP